MKKIISKHIDDFIFKQIDLFKESEAKTKINDTLNSLTEQQHKIFSQAGSFALIFIPFIVLVSIFISNSFLKSNIEMKKEILTEIEYFNSKKSEVESVGRQIISPHTIKNTADLDKRLQRIASQRGISSDSIKVISFESLEKSGAIEKSEASINVSKLTSKNLSNLLQRMLDSEKFKIFEMSLKRDNKLSLIEGNIKFTHYAKVSN
ncbi:hypothetical protein BIY24_05985 [Halobacteriovorax marinus]|uniref:hypothetical protein n=1 Tax=Halobacteriovorax marinus TaxID=97084 RepID=UPI000BC2EB7E|nr:hypothetical protein [Halobacteriovorax marinus]ATH07507.1 hypothetical protein BIY24_05985 [Halobacteriovorax marinus]